MKHILILLIVSTLAVTTTAQSIDNDRMHRDLEVAEKALSTVISSESGDLARWPSMHDGDVEAGYVKDYGVVFTVNNRNLRIFTVKGKGKSKNKDNKGSNLVTAKSVLAGSNKDQKNNFIDHSKTFLADYAGIIGQLKDDNRISVRMGGSDSHYSSMNLEDVYVTGVSSQNTTTIWSPSIDHSASSELIIEASVGDIKSLRMGKITRDQFFEKVKVIENEMSYEKDADMETLVAMFHRLYKKDLSNTYYSEHKPKYSKLSNFGVIVKMKFYSSYEDDNEYSMPTIAKEGLTLEQRNQHVMDLLPKFEADFKENLVNYGRTLKNLDKNETLMFEINMTTCKGCDDFPRYMKFSIKNSTLDQFNKGDLSMKQAADMVSVDRILK